MEVKALGTMGVVVSQDELQGCRWGLGTSLLIL